MKKYPKSIVRGVCSFLVDIIKCYVFSALIISNEISNSSLGYSEFYTNKKICTNNGGFAKLFLN